MGCPNCEHQNTINENAKLESLKEDFREEAAEAGYTAFAIIKCWCNPTGYIWRPIGHPDCEKYGVVEFCVAT